MKRGVGTLLFVLLLVGGGAAAWWFYNSSLVQFGDYEVELAFAELTFNDPVDLQHAGDDRLFVVEQDGVIRVFSNDRDVPSSDVFLDIRDEVQSGGERGLLGLAFHPEYAENGRFFVHFTAPGPLRSVVAEYSVENADPDRADANSGRIILEVEQPYGNHNGGQIGFGPEGFLHIALGDGGASGDPHGHGQNRSTLLGSILRIDVDAGTNQSYGIPPTNPFRNNGEGFREEIIAYGLRNPWRFSFDSETGDLWVADVGQNSWEEINIVSLGANFGWDRKEGRHCFEPPTNCDDGTLVDPVHEYEIGIEGNTVIGGYVYHGSRISSLQGRYIYGDHGSGKIWAITYEGGAENEELVDTNLDISTFGVDVDGELYICALSGHIYRFSA